MKMTDLTEINSKVRERVKKRDSWEGANCCIYCGSPHGIQVHHFIERSRGGMGIEQNLVSLCYRCHAKLHGGDTEIKNFCWEYLHERYPDYTERDLIYRKEDYK